LRRALAEQAGEGSEPGEVGPTAAAESLDAETLALVFAAGVEQLYVLSLDRQRGLQVLPGGAGPASALRLAKLELIDAERPPSDWAAFGLLGDWRYAPPSSTFPSPSGPMK
jgi:hypothetical protein